MRKIKHWSIGGLLFSLLSTPLFATTTTTTFTVTATINGTCSVNASTLAFGVYNPTSASNLDNTTTIGVTCTNGTVYDVGLDAGTGSGASVTTRKLTRTVGGTDTINYSLYQDSAHTVVWGNTVGVNTVSGTGSGSAQNLTVYGRIPGNQGSIPPASYSDTITVTVTF